MCDHSRIFRNAFRNALLLIFCGTSHFETQVHRLNQCLFCLPETFAACMVTEHNCHSARPDSTAKLSRQTRFEETTRRFVLDFLVGRSKLDDLLDLLPLATGVICAQVFSLQLCDESVSVVTVRSCHIVVKTLASGPTGLSRCSSRLILSANLSGCLYAYCNPAIELLFAFPFHILATLRNDYL